MAVVLAALILSEATMAEGCPLSAPLTLKDVQGGVVGETGTVWTIAPDCSFTIARKIGPKLLASHKQGRLTAEQQARLKDMLARISPADFPERLGAAPQANARRLSLSYGNRETTLTLAPGGGDLRRLRAQPDDARGQQVLEMAAAMKDMLGD